MKFGIICEGITDFHVLKHIIQSFNEQAEFQPIQPCLDETHKKTSEGNGRNPVVKTASRNWGGADEDEDFAFRGLEGIN